MMFNVHLEFHPMLGVDFHDEICPPPVPPVKMEPHIVAALMNWVMPSSLADTTRNMPGLARVMNRGTDIENFIPHIPIGPGLLLAPLIIATSGSKTHFGPARVKANGDAIAAAILVIVGVNLNCSDPLPMPTGLVLAPNTVMTSMSMGDIIGSCFAMATDAICQGLIQKGLGKFGSENPLLKEAYVKGVLGALAQLLGGSPLGFSFGTKSSDTGIIGVIGRNMGHASDLARGLGELLGGDVDQGLGDMGAAAVVTGHDAVETGKQVAALLAPFVGIPSPIFAGIANAARAHDAPAPDVPPPGPAFDHPAMETI